VFDYLPEQSWETSKPVMHRRLFYEGAARRARSTVYGALACAPMLLPAMSFVKDASASEQVTTVAESQTPATSVTGAVVPPQPADATNTDAETDSNVARTGGQSPVTGPTPTSAIDISALEDRLVDTDAIGFFTKLELKSQLDDLTEKFRAFHQTTSADALPKLREEYDLLLLKLLSLLQDEDPTLHHDIATARPQIWRTLADPILFAKL
jgi:hypothetical protein